MTISQFHKDQVQNAEGRLPGHRDAGWRMEGRGLRRKYREWKRDQAEARNETTHPEDRRSWREGLYMISKRGNGYRTAPVRDFKKPTS